MAEKNIREMTLEECRNMTIGELMDMIRSEKIREEERPFDLEIEVTEILSKMGIPANIKGYRYVRDAILYTIENPLVMDSVTKGLYPVIAQEYNTTWLRVERAIRHAIEIAWERGNAKAYFGCKTKKNCVKPTNSELIAKIADKLRLKYKLG